MDARWFCGRDRSGREAEMMGILRRGAVDEAVEYQSKIVDCRLL